MSEGRFMKLTLTAAAALLFVAGAAEALPLAAAPVAGDPPVVLAAQGCGFGAHRGAFGGCRLNRGPRGQIRRAITGAPRGCPPRMYRGPRGVCRYR
jgi:hypothetical protein